MYNLSCNTQSVLPVIMPSCLGCKDALTKLKFPGLLFPCCLNDTASDKHI